MARTKQATKIGDNITAVRHDEGDPQSSETDDQGRSKTAQPARRRKNKEEGPTEGQQSKFEGDTASHDTTTPEDQVGVADPATKEAEQQDTPSQGGGGQEGGPKDPAANKGLSEDTEPHPQQLQEGSKTNQHSRDCRFHNFGGERDDGLTDRDATRNRRAIQLGHKDELDEERLAYQVAKARDQEDLGEEERVEKVADHLPSEQTPAKTHVERTAEGDDLMQTKEDGPLTGAKGQQGRKRQMAGPSQGEKGGEADRKKRVPPGQELGQGRRRTKAEVRRSLQVGMKPTTAQRGGAFEHARVRKEVDTWNAGKMGWTRTQQWTTKNQPERAEATNP